ncbi:GTPase [Ottowia thiooxydans]|uniref:GTP-binding protein EngB required for normal cell division n=1 Tax=Ottowia thiooxydans TaxID=219182 RepID=A0ABV2Q732_9BURK
MMHFPDRPDQEQTRRLLQDSGAVVAVLPGRAHDLARLGLLADRTRPPVVTVIGKYNHGKSRLLNELIGHTAFAVADKRETVELSAHVHQGVQWLDAPGLDADVGSVDDEHALQATWLESDIRLFVHAVKEGELDASERTLLEALHCDGLRYGRQTLLVLTQIDQLSSDDQYRKVADTIGSQAPAFGVHPVSSTRYRQGVEGGKTLLLERSGIPALQRVLQGALERVPSARAHEAQLLLGDVRSELTQLVDERLARVCDLRAQQTQQRQRFDFDLLAVLDKVALDIRALIDVPGPDHSLTPDSFAEQFKMTPGKRERNRLQVGYSKACIEINAVLIKHGVSELPQAQRTSVRSLDNVMVAVMGVYVKYRKDLNQIFCEEAGRARMQCEFARYFELSPDRVELAAEISAAAGAVDAAQRALVALETLEARASALEMSGGSTA